MFTLTCTTNCKEFHTIFSSATLSLFKVKSTNNHHRRYRHLRPPPSEIQELVHWSALSTEPAHWKWLFLNEYLNFASMKVLHRVGSCFSGPRGHGVVYGVWLHRRRDKSSLDEIHNKYNICVSIDLIRRFFVCLLFVHHRFEFPWTSCEKLECEGKEQIHAPIDLTFDPIHPPKKKHRTKSKNGMP